VKSNVKESIKKSHKDKANRAFYWLSRKLSGVGLVEANKVYQSQLKMQQCEHDREDDNIMDFLPEAIGIYRHNASSKEDKVV
jgi:hypothetical protein